MNKYFLDINACGHSLHAHLIYYYKLNVYNKPFFTLNFKITHFSRCCYLSIPVQY